METILDDTGFFPDGDILNVALKSVLISLEQDEQTLVLLGVIFII